MLAGLVALLTSKGRKLHKRLGFVFFISMLLVNLPAVALALIKSNHFLLSVAIFSFYMNFTGYVVLRKSNFLVAKIHWAVLLIGLLFALYMVATVQIVSMVFGMLLLLMIAGDLRKQLYDKENLQQENRKRVLVHIARMTGAYISTLTAFLVVNITFVKPPWLLWLTPTILLTPLIIYWIRKWKVKLRLM